MTKLNVNKLSKPQLFKGIALFTPGGDLMYCIDPNKQGRWHLNLCAALQEILDLPEPPHFLVPCYTATIDHWLNPRTQQVQIFAEAYPAVIRHQAVLNAIFGTGIWCGNQHLGRMVCAIAWYYQLIGRHFLSFGKIMI